MITPDYYEKEHHIQQIFNTEGIVLLQKFLDSPKKAVKMVEGLPKNVSFHPLRHRWSVCNDIYLGKYFMDVIVYLKHITGEELYPTAYVLGKGDFSLLSDEIKEEHGIVAFLELTKHWNDEWGGYLGIEQEKVHLPSNGILISALHSHRWFVKYVNHKAKENMILVVFREKRLNKKL